MDKTIEFYNRNASAFFKDTVSVDMSELHARFLLKIPEGGIILDAGCGSGRDSKAFKDLGYRVAAFDAATAMATLAGELLKQSVSVRCFDDIDEVSFYDGIWVCASLLHLPSSELPEALHRLWSALKPGGTIYLSFKEGRGEREKDGRHFTDLDENALRVLLKNLCHVEKIDCWQTLDQRPGRSDKWLNALVRRKAQLSDKLITGGPHHPFLPSLLAGIRQATEIDLAVAFIKSTGLRLLFSDLKEAIEPSENGPQFPARLRIITSDYLDVTDPEALRSLMLLKERGAQVRVYESAGSSFHMKAYVFVTKTVGSEARGMAYVGSSNISRQALQDGLEWNYRVDASGLDKPAEYAGYAEILSRFEELFANTRSVPLTYPWIDAYEQRRRLPAIPVAPGSNEREAPPEPTSIQKEALAALNKSREEGYRRGLVVMATGLGKTWLAAFDSQQMSAKRVLFVAHREEILFQAESTFLRIRPHARVGFYTGKDKDTEVDILCASVQTLGKFKHLNLFSRRHFDYVVVDEFHHAAATTYRRLLAHFDPCFLLGLTATPDRTDQSDILSLCDDNLVFARDIFIGISSGMLAPFHYFGIYDDEVNYREIPWRSGRFDPEQLSNKLATLARARHAYTEWQQKSQKRTLAFCVSIRHADFMADRFRLMGVKAEAVYAGSTLARGEALECLTDGRLQVIFSVDLFNEGVDLPGIDTVMLLRPTESKILFLQQIGRGLRKVDNKHLVILDFIGNHHSFFHKPQALFNVRANYKALADFARRVEQNDLIIPEGCFVNYDLEIINFLKDLDSDSAQKDYKSLCETLGRRPTLTEFYRSGASVAQMRRQYDSWILFVKAMGGCSLEEEQCVVQYEKFFREVETTPMTKSFKMVLLEALLEHEGLFSPPTLETLAQQSLALFQRRRKLVVDLREDLQEVDSLNFAQWQSYWKNNPVNAWTGGNRDASIKAWFKVVDNKFIPNFKVDASTREILVTFLQELVDYRLATYEARSQAANTDNLVPLNRKSEKIDLAYFPNIKIACGQFRSGQADAEEYRSLGVGHGKLDPARHFIARASGNSMNGGKKPILDGDYLLLERISPQSAGSITGQVMAIERQDSSGDNQYLLRLVTKPRPGRYILRATNPDYEDIEAVEDMRTFARLKEVLDPLELAVGQNFIREDIPALFGHEFNPGNWHSGHVVLNDKRAHILLVTLNKQGKSEEHRYHDYWMDEKVFHWQSQNSTTPESKRGRALIKHQEEGITIHLFIRDNKLVGGKAAPFTYYGPVTYRSHKGSAPMGIEWELLS